MSMVLGETTGTPPAAAGGDKDKNDGSAPPNETPHAVSFCEEQNTTKEIPRIDPTDKQNLWFSRSELHMNSVMTARVREAVKVKLVELLVCDNDDDEEEEELPFPIPTDENDGESFATTIPDCPTDERDTDGLLGTKPGPPNAMASATATAIATENPRTDAGRTASPSTIAKQIEERILYQKAEVVQNRLDEIMELPPDEILAFLTSGGGPHAKKEPPPPPPPESPPPAADDVPYNWILDSDLEWKDLPDRVRKHCSVLGYTETSWNEEDQDLAFFVTPWSELAPGQRHALWLLGSYDEPSWNRDVGIMRERAERTAADSGENAAESFSSSSSSSSSSQDDAPTAASGDRSDDRRDRSMGDSGSDDDNSNDDDEMKAFISNFLPDEAEEQNQKENRNIEDKNEDNDTAKATSDDDDDEMAEFISNFLPDEAEEQNQKENNDSNVPNVTNDNGNNDDDDEEMAEFISNFLPDEVEQQNQKENQNIKENNKDKVPNSIADDGEDNDDDDEEMADFISNFLPDEAEQQTQKENQNAKENNNDKVPNSIDDDGDDKDDDDEEMAEFISNFLPGEAEQQNQKENQNVKENNNDKVPNSIDDDGDDKDDDDEEMAEFISNFLSDEAEERKQEKKQNIKENNNDIIPYAIDDDDEEMAEFISNFVVDDNEQKIEDNASPSSNGDGDSNGNAKGKNSDITTDKEDSRHLLAATEDTAHSPPDPGGDEDKDEKAMMGEFISNILPDHKEDPEETKAQDDIQNDGEDKHPFLAKEQVPIENNDDDAVEVEGVPVAPTRGSNHEMAWKQDEEKQRAIEHDAKGDETRSISLHAGESESTPLLPCKENDRNNKRSTTESPSSSSRSWIPYVVVAAALPLVWLATNHSQPPRGR